MRLSTHLRRTVASALVSTAAAANAAPAIDRPCFDLLFGVSTFTPGLEADALVSLVALDDAIHVRYSRMPPRNGPTSLWKSLHWYRARTGTVETIPLPSPKDVVSVVAALRGEQFMDYTVLPTEGLAFVGSATAPDGFKLGEPRWVRADPVSQVLGNIALLIAAGGTETITEREPHPRLERGPVSLPMRSGNASLNNGADTAFFLRWAVPKDGPPDGCDARPDAPLRK